MAIEVPDLPSELHVVVPYLAEAAAWWESSLVSGLVGAVTGAVIGGGISWVLSRQASNETLRRDAAARTAQEKGVATVAVIKAGGILNGLSSTATAMIEPIDFANANGHAGLDLWQKVQPIVGSVLPHRFDPEEIAQMTTIDQKLGNDLALLEAKALSFYSSLDVYFERRLALTDSMPAQIHGPIRITPLTLEQYNLYAPRAAELNMLAEQILESLDDDITFGVPVCEALGPACKAHFEVEKFIGLDYSGIKARRERLHALRLDHRSMPAPNIV